MILYLLHSWQLTLRHTLFPPLRTGMLQPSQEPPLLVLTAAASTATMALPSTAPKGRRLSLSPRNNPFQVLLFGPHGAR